MTRVDDLNLLRCCGTEDRLELILRGGDVRRYHAEPRAHISQDVASHTWRMMAILLHLWPEASPELLRAALYHDVAEGYTGDVPAPVKRHELLRAGYGAIEKEFMEHIGLAGNAEDPLSDDDHTRLKLADYIELCLTCAGANTRRAWQIHGVAKAYVWAAFEKLTPNEAQRIGEIFTRMEGR